MNKLCTIIAVLALLSFTNITQAANINEMVNGAPAYFNLFDYRTLESFEKLVNEGADLTLVDNRNYSIFSNIYNRVTSKYYEKLGIFEKYLTTDIAKALPDKDYLLEIAIYNKLLLVIELLIKGGALIKGYFGDLSYESATLKEVVNSEQPEILKMLLQSEANLLIIKKILTKSYILRNGKKPHLEVLKLLIANGARITSSNLSEYVHETVRPELFIELFKAVNIEEAMTEYKRNHHGGFLVFNALEAKNYAGARLALNHGGKIDNMTIRYCFISEDLDCIDIVSKNEAFEANKDGALIKLLGEGMFPAAKKLIEYGAEFARNKPGASLLHWIINSHERGQYLGSEELLSRVKGVQDTFGLPLTIKDEKGISLLQIAVASKSIDLVKYLLAEGLNPLYNTTDQFDSAFDSAVGLEFFAAAEAMKIYVTDRTAYLGSVNRLLDAYAGIRGSDMIAFLIEAIFEQGDIEQYLRIVPLESLIYYAARAGNKEILLKLKEKGISSFHAALLKCTQENLIDSVNILLEMGINPDMDLAELISLITTVEMADLYEKHGIKIDRGFILAKKLIQEAIKHKNAEEFAKLITIYPKVIGKTEYKEIFISRSAPMIHALIENVPDLQNVLLVGLSKYYFSFTDGIKGVLDYRIKGVGDGYVVALTRRIVKDEFIMKHLSGIVNPGNGDSFPLGDQHFKLEDLHRINTSEKLYQEAVSYAKAQLVPYLGICSGSQHLVLNSGGYLKSHGHSTSEADIHLIPGTMAHFMSLSDEEKAVALEECRLEPVVAKDAKVAHSYAGVEGKLGKSVKLGGLSAHGPVEAFTADGMFVGVQYHPERAYFKTVEGVNRQKEILDSYFDLCLAYHKSKQYAKERNIPEEKFKKAFMKARKILDDALESCATQPRPKSIQYIWRKNSNTEINFKELHDATIYVMEGVTPADITITKEGNDVVLQLNDSSSMVRIVGGQAGGSVVSLFLAFSDGSAFHVNDIDQELCRFDDVQTDLVL